MRGLHTTHENVKAQSPNVKSNLHSVRQKVHSFYLDPDTSLLRETCNLSALYLRGQERFSVKALLFGLLALLNMCL
jgi:hypothetical protein